MANNNPQVTLLSLDRLGISETFFEPRGSSNFYVFCDALNLADSSKNSKIARHFEKIIKQYIQLNWAGLNEKLLRKAIEHAQGHFYKHYLSYERQLKINVIIFACDPSVQKDEKPRLLIAGLGDIKLYQIDASIQLIYYDPEIPQLPEHLSLKKRFHYNTNSIGVPDTKCHISSATLEHGSTLLVASYGAYHQTQKAKLFNIFSQFESKKNLVYKTLNRLKDNDHMCFFARLSCQKAERKKDLKTLAIGGEKASPVPEENKPRKSSPAWILKIASVAIMCILSLELFNHFYKANTSQKGYSISDKEKVVELQSSLESKELKKSLEFPFLKERAYILDLKEKYDHQTKIIEQLQSIVDRQEQILNSLQKPTEVPSITSSISAGAYTPDKPEDQESEN